jgi:hypothetical protein
MTQLEFNSLWQASPGVDFELPACDEGMALLKLWAQNDATLTQELPIVPENAKGTLAHDFYRHFAQCPKCNEL